MHSSPLNGLASEVLRTMQQRYETKPVKKIRIICNIFDLCDAGIQPSIKYFNIIILIINYAWIEIVVILKCFLIYSIEIDLNNWIRSCRWCLCTEKLKTDLSRVEDFIILSEASHIILHFFLSFSMFNFQMHCYPATSSKNIFWSRIRFFHLFWMDSSGMELEIERFVWLIPRME